VTVSQRLNITNGDVAVGKMTEAGIDGKIIAWRDVLHEGPVDSSLSLEELSKQRARFISGNSWDDFEQVSGDFAERDRMIRHLDYFDEVVLWFEDDLYDQLQLIQLLDFFSREPARKKKLSIIVVDGYLPPLSHAELKRLEASRPRVTAEQLSLAQRAWKAFGSKDPSSIERILAESTSALPHLRRALHRHLEEFPSTVNGLSRSEREALTAIKEGHRTPVAAFMEVARKQESIFLGDLVFFSYLERLSGTKHPLVTWKDDSPVLAPTREISRDFIEGELSLTDLGHQVLAGEKDWHQINTESRWLGGVEVVPRAEGWRWDPVARRLTHSSLKHGAKSKPKRTAAKTAKSKRSVGNATKSNRTAKSKRSGTTKSRRVAKKPARKSTRRKK